MSAEPKLHVTFRVTAYDDSGYGDNRSQNFTDGEAAIEYAKSLELRFGAVVYKTITMEPISVLIYKAGDV